MNEQLIQHPDGTETTLSEWIENPQARPPQKAEQPDKFLEWEARRGMMRTIGDAQEEALALTQAVNEAHLVFLFTLTMGGLLL